MPPISILRSTPFRLALMFTFLSILTFTVSSVIIYLAVRTDLEQRLDRQINNTFSVIAASYGTKDIEDLIASVENYINYSSGSDIVLLLTDPEGHSLAGNMPTYSLAPGWSAIQVHDSGISGEGSYRVLSGEVDGYRLSVGMSYAQTSEFLEIALSGFVWGSLVVIISAVAGGVFLATRVQQRMEAIAGTLVNVSHGDLTARIALLRKGDDIDLLSRQINAALDRLAALVEGMRQVSTDIAHDLKTPLNRLQMTIDDAIHKEAEGLSVAVELAEARLECDGINDTFGALLRIAQIESGARKSRFVELDLQDIVALIVEIYSDVAADKNKTIVFAADSLDPAIVLGDRELLLQLFANIVENAIRHCPDGTEIRLSLTHSYDKITTTVADNGPGIPDGERENVLRRLYRLDKSRTTPGTGLGLSLVKAIAELHAADLQLEDNMPGLRVSLLFLKALKGN